jgi:hypothetical protein
MRAPRSGRSAPHSSAPAAATARAASGASLPTPIHRRDPPPHPPTHPHPAAPRDRSGSIPDLRLLDNSPILSYVVEALSATLTELGVRHTVAAAMPADSDATYLLLITHEAHVKLPGSYIAYNLEQLTTDKEWPAFVFDRYRAALMVWDFSPANIALLAARGVRALHVPLGYAPTLARPLPAVGAKDVDVLFIGTLNARRLHALAGFSAPPGGGGLATLFSDHTRGDELLLAYARSKVAVNIHYFGSGQLLEMHRILPLLAHRVWVVSEPSTDAWLDGALAGIVDFSEGEGLVAAVAAALARPDFAAEVDARLERFKARCAYRDYVRAAMGERYVVPDGGRHAPLPGAAAAAAA